jgi:hypothetical protein
MTVPEKAFRLRPDQIAPVAVGLGACIATDRITVDGMPVGYCYREVPDNDPDSGWRFFAGDESPEYMDDPSNHGIYDLNTIANYDPDIVSLLAHPAPCAFEKSGDGRFLPVADAPDDED